MFEVRKSIKRFRDDPAWTYRKRDRAYLDTFNHDGYPFSLGPDGLSLRHLLQGSLQGREVSMFHLRALKGSGRAHVAWPYSVAVLPLPRALPATAFTSRRLMLPGREKRPALPRTPGRFRDLTEIGTHRVHCHSEDVDFAALINTYALERLMHKAQLGWRIEGSRMIGWTDGRKTYEDLLSLAETVASIIDDFPAEAWHWTQ
ncbi:hypothetical protein K2224_01220 [Streptomyces sp. BHT-5-2]|uniref:hypothetical protein n=1 Tax=Streptomyces sp. BHT-5-2 TaxID=2866715 RepID=UPI001C8EA129|nr:hypothetical protein [Streptomyces sp. BHT-5-2]QZL02009.1 hypothetical protein K2224_01220 [Streptomyces sp. BHT-5-2]